MNPPTSNTGLYTKIITRDGVLGLISFMTVSFIMSVVYYGQQANTTVLAEIKNEATKQTGILQDIRYSIKAQGGVTFRNNP